MHEQGIAASVIEAVLRNGLARMPLRLLVTGGRSDPAAFDAALLSHLEADPRWAVARVEIVHQAVDTVCSGCARIVKGGAAGDACASCGAPPLPVSFAERIEVEALDKPSQGPG